ncbi:hypothetical protein BH23ACT2_BH23ACT2_09450 [soil metagenome]
MTDAAGTGTILVANPDNDAREVLARVVETAGFSAVRVASAAEVAQVTDTKGGADTESGAGGNGLAGAVVDLGADNLAVLEALRNGEHGDAARVVVLGTGPANGRLALGAGADGYLVRPFHAHDLQAALTDALARPEVERAPWRTEAAAAL